MDEALHDKALADGLIRYCPICDGYEVTDRKVGVIGSDSHGVAEALFLRGYTADVTLIAPDKAMALRQKDWEKLERFGIRTVDGPCRAVGVDEATIFGEPAEGTPRFYSFHPAPGPHPHSHPP